MESRIVGTCKKCGKEVDESVIGVSGHTSIHNEGDCTLEGKIIDWCGGDIDFIKDRGPMNHYLKIDHVAFLLCLPFALLILYQWWFVIFFIISWSISGGYDEWEHRQIQPPIFRDLWRLPKRIHK